MDFYSYSSEKNTSYFNYKDKINKYLESLDESVVVPYLRFKLDYNAACSRDIIGIVLQIDSQISVVDLYNSFVEILQHNSYYNYFGNKNIVVNIEKYIDDYRLHNLMIFYGVYDKFDDYLDKHNSVYKIIEKYTVGAYDEVIEMSMNYIKSKPEDFQMRHFLAKAVINSKRKMEIEAIALDDIFNIYSLNSKFSESILNLYNMLKLYQGTSWKYKIRGFICRKQAVTDNCLDVFVSHISDCVITPNYVGYISDKENFLKSFYNYCPNTAELFLYLSGVKTELSESLSLDFIRKNVYISAREIGNGENEEAIRHLKSALSVVNNTDFYNMERVGRKLFVAYKNLKLWKELIDLTVTFFMKNPNLCKRFKLGECIDSIKRCKDVEVRGNIKTPIFMYIYDKNDYKLQRIAYANYIDKNNIKNVTDLCQTAQEKEEIVFFLFRICYMNVLKRDIRLAKNTDEVEKVRIDILRNLMALDEKNKKTYYDEINKIMLKRSIRDKIKQFNQSRIYVDTEKIGDEYYEIFKENYDKYMLLKSFDEKLSMLDITSEKYLDDLKKIMENINTRLKQDVNYSQEVVVLKDLISRIADQFLFNEKYGLNTFLSSRIRHGYCQNKLLTIFYDYHLTSKSLENTSSNYNVNEYWDEKVINKGQTYEMFKEILSNFTLKIDTKVNQIKKEWLRIKNHENEEGLFDFRDFVKNCVLVITSNDEMIQDYEIFYQSIIDLFWIYTEKNLVIVREKIKNDLKKYFWECINELENSIAPLEKTSLKSVFIEMKNNINICKTKIDTVIQEFSDVFYKRDISYCDYTMRDVIILTAYDELEEKIKENENLKGLQVLKYSETSMEWSECIKKRIEYIIACEENEKAEKVWADVALITAVKTESEAVRKIFNNLEKVRIKNDPTIYYRTELKKNITIVTAQQSEMGMAAAATLSTKMIEHFKPKYIIMVGIAAGIGNDKNLGDIIIPSEVWNYSSGKYIESKNGQESMLEFLPDPVSIPLEAKIREVVSQEFKERLFGIRNEADNAPENELKVVIGPMACGAAVVANKDIVEELIKKHHRKTVGLDMESYGVFFAAKNVVEVGTIPICIKSICDFADANKGDSAQKYAAFTSTLFAKKLIEEDLEF